MKIYLLCLLNVLLLASGQMLFRYGTQGREAGSFVELIRLFFSPVIILALAVYGGATLLWLYILKQLPLSTAYPILALSFPLVVLLSVLIFHEDVPITRWIGIGVILIGVIIATR